MVLGSLYIYIYTYVVCIYIYMVLGSLYGFRLYIYIRMWYIYL